MDKLQGIAAGDRVRVTFEGVVMEYDPIDFYTSHPHGDLLISADGATRVLTFSAEATRLSSFTIEKLQPELAPGDRLLNPSGFEQKVVAIEGDTVVFRSADGDLFDYPLADTVDWKRLS